MKVVAGDVYHEGISRITGHDIAVARRLGYVVKLLGIADQDQETGEVAVRVHPAMVPMTHPLASVRESYNAVFIEGGAVGSLMFYGRGAGGMPTASAVLGDVIDAAVNLSKGTHGSLGSFGRAAIRPIDETSAEYLLSMDVADRPGVLHAVTGVFARHGVSIRAAEQEGNAPDARLVFITHDAKESSVQADFVLRLIGEKAAAFTDVEEVWKDVGETGEGRFVFRALARGDAKGFGIGEAGLDVDGFGLAADHVVVGGVEKRAAGRGGGDDGEWVAFDH